MSKGVETGFLLVLGVLAVSKESSFFKLSCSFPFSSGNSGGGGTSLKGACEPCSSSSECTSECCWRRGPADYVCLGTKGKGSTCTQHC